MNYFKIGERDFFLGKELGKKKITLLNWIQYQQKTGDVSMIYEDHVCIACKKDEKRYPFPITSNRGHLMISREAYETWESKFEREEELDELQLAKIDPEKVRLERFIRNIVDISLLNEIQSMIDYRRIELENVLISQVPITKKKENKNLKRIQPTFLSTIEGKKK
jgi:hypothetical protein